MMKEIRINAWYHHPRFGYAQLDRVEQNFATMFDKDGKEWCLGISTPELSGPYHIEPGDRVKPKPAGDKCWDRGEGLTFKDCWEREYSRLSDSNLVTGYGAAMSRVMVANPIGGSSVIPLSCLILVQKAEKAQPRNGNPWTSAVAPNFVSTPEPDRDTETWCTPHPQLRPVGGPNPATLPSPLGGEQTWPDVKPGALLDTLPMNMHTTEDELVARDSDYQVCRMGDALGCIENIELGIVNNSDRERIRKIIPEIERKLTQLKGRL